MLRPILFLVHFHFIYSDLRFAAFVDVLAIMTRGTPDEKMEFCYKM